MKKIFLVVLTIFVMTIACTGSAFASWSFYLENTENNNVFEIWFLTDEEVVLNNYQLSFVYDTDEMTWDGDYTNDPPSPLVELFGYPQEYGDPGLIENFTAATFSGGATVSSDILLGTLTFDILSSAVKDGSDDLSWAVDSGDNTNFIVTVDSVEYNFSDGADLSAHLLTGADLDVSSVPIPGAVWLLGSGLLGLMGLRRRKSI